MSNRWMDKLLHICTIEYNTDVKKSDEIILHVGWNWMVLCYASQVIPRANTRSFHSSVIHRVTKQGSTISNDDNT